MMIPSTIDKRIKVMSLSVLDVKNLAIVDFDKEDPVKYINTLVIKRSSLAMLENRLVGGLFLDILKMSNVDVTEETEAALKRISSVANTYPQIFGDSKDRPDLREEINQLYHKVIDDIQPSLEEFYKTIIAIYTQTSIQPSELEQMAHWEFKYLLKALK